MTERALTSGQRWAAEQLEELRGARFAPGALGAFLVASLRRSAEVRAARPDLARQSRRWMTAGAVAWLALAFARVEPFCSRRRAGLGWWAATALMLDWHLGMLETPRGAPRPLGPADAATLARAWLVPVVATHPTALVCLIAGASDVVDGRLARATAPTRAGRDLEGLVDACFLAAALAGLRRRRALGRGVVIAEGARVTAGIAYAVYEYFGQARAPDEEVLGAGRASTAARLGGLAAAAAGRRRVGGTLLAAGSTAGLAEVAMRMRWRAQRDYGWGRATLSGTTLVPRRGGRVALVEPALSKEPARGGRWA
ncbi:MAG TPA: CDP-alcohol phosphatidyltransferase family protein [Solirubrobacteraceae bacterium]|nr:CDP-alcohol phosphatidyltransferase family protein [Solirubrobacteraceae bacterium]